MTIVARGRLLRSRYTRRCRAGFAFQNTHQCVIDYSRTQDTRYFAYIYKKSFLDIKYILYTLLNNSYNTFLTAHRSMTKIYNYFNKH